MTSAAAGIPWHSWATAASHGTDGAVKSAYVAAKVLALTGVDLLTDPKLVAEARAYFLEKTGGKRYESPIPVDQKPPLPRSTDSDGGAMANKGGSTNRM